MEKKLFEQWLSATKELQETAFKFDFSTMVGDSPENINKLVEYMRWNMLAVDDEMAEMRQAISWKPWQHDKPYADREEIIKEAVDVLHFIANMLVAAGATDEVLNGYYLEKMERNRARQAKGYTVRADGEKCVSCNRAIDDVGANETDARFCSKCVAE